ncbi:MAG TPA: hypothetical protein VMH61_00745 [Candidatus Acidoferrales bacterium]|nr:hypothetical protein [Candidatus Acidoferrales bacterium]
MARPETAIRVLFVCTGNTCRSPFAAAAMRGELAADASRIVVESAGTSALEGQPATSEMQRVAGRAGLDLSPHRARAVTARELREADFVFVMEPRHRDALAAMGAPLERVHLISEWPEPGEPGLRVSDPFGGSREGYEECGRRILHHVRRIVPAVRQALQARNAS